MLQECLDSFGTEAVLFLLGTPVDGFPSSAELEVSGNIRPKQTTTTQSASNCVHDPDSEKEAHQLDASVRLLISDLVPLNSDLRDNRRCINLKRCMCESDVSLIRELCFLQTSLLRFLDASDVVSGSTGHMVRYQSSDDLYGKLLLTLTTILHRVCMSMRKPDRFLLLGDFMEIMTINEHRLAKQSSNPLLSHVCNQLISEILNEA